MTKEANESYLASLTWELRGAEAQLAAAKAANDTENAKVHERHVADIKAELARVGEDREPRSRTHK